MSKYITNGKIDPSKLTTEQKEFVKKYDQMKLEQLCAYLDKRHKAGIIISTLKDYIK